MSLSLRNIGKKIEDVIGGVERQVNPFDHGATYSNPSPSPSPAPHPATPVPPPVFNNHPVAFGANAPPSFMQAPPPAPVVKTKSAQKSPIPAPQVAPPQPVKTANSPVKLGKVSVKAAPLPTGTQSSTTPLDLARSFVTQPAAEIASTIANKTYHPGPGLQQDLFGKTPIKPIQQDVKGVYQAVKAGHQNLPGGIPISPSLAAPYAAADAVFHAANDIPFVGAAGKGIKAVAKAFDPAVDATRVAEAAKPSVKVAETVAPTPKPKIAEPTPAEKATSVIKSQGSPETPLPAGKVVKSTTSMPAVNKAIQDVSTQYATPTSFSGGIQEVVGQAQGASSVGSRAARGLRKALKDNLTPEENGQVSDILGGHPGAVKAATPKAVEAAKALKPLQDQGFDIRKAIDPSVNKVQDYISRLPANTVGQAVDAGVKVLGKIRSLSDITNLNSVFSKSRTIGKFVDKQNNAVYGSAKDLGLTRHTDGTITDTQGNPFKQVAVSNRELEANGAGKYEHNAARISGVYHADTASLKVRAEALQHIKGNPEAVGLHTIDTAPEGSVAVTRIPELKDMYGSPKDVKALEDNFGFKNAANPVGKAYDAVSNVATQFIVLNPFFHGMNQLYQTGIAAGNIPGLATGWTKVAARVMDVGEQDIRDYLTAGGHIPDYGMGRENLLSNMTHGATKINNKAMNAIETRLRVGLYKASIEQGMKPGAAVKNIDKFLGDAHQISAGTRRFTLFFHYFKTMTGAVGSQIAHPVEQAGSIFNTAALAAITAAVTYGYQQFTGNPNAYARVPGELGLIKEGIGSVEGIAKGDASKATQVVTNRINPLLKEGLQQGFNQDLFTGKKVTDTPAAIPRVPGGRVSHAIGGLVAPAQVGSRVVGGNKTLPEVGINQLGIYTPHSGPQKDKNGKILVPAGPASPNNRVAFLNAKGAKPVPGNDPTGYQQQQAFFSTSKDAKKGLSSDDQKAFDQLTASTAKMNDKQIQGHYADLSSNPKVLEAIAKQKQVYAKKTGTPLDPLYSKGYTPEQRQAYLHMLSLPYKGDDYIQQQDAAGGKKAENGWMYQLTQARNDYFNKVKFADASKAERVQPPQFDPATQSALDQASNLSGAEKAQFITAHPEVQQAYDALAKYTNDKRIAQGNAPFKLFPSADPATQAALNEYQAVPKGGGSKGGNKYIAEWIQANPDKYAKIQSYYSNVSEYELANSAGQDKYQGATPSQEELKSAYSLGQYDIVKTKNADGTSTYALNPSAAAAAYGSSTGGSSSFSSKFNTADHRAYKDAKALRYTNKIPRIGAKIKRPNVKLAKASKGKVALKSTKGAKISVRPSKV